MDVAEVKHWVRLLRSVAQAGQGPIPVGLAPWFQRYRGVITEPTRPPRGKDEELWRALCDADGHAPHRSALGHSPSPLFPFGAEDTIEVWTERDLSGMHAISRLLERDLERDDDEAWRQALEGAIRWHLEHTQPDNATGRPWAIHVFIARWIEDGDIESRLYAETLLHNCQMQMGTADPLSAEILKDAAEALVRRLET